MSATLTPTHRTARAVPPVRAELPTAWVLYAVLLSSACIIVGLIWDISWHMSIGRDTLWSPPHIIEQIGASVAGLAYGWLVLETTFAGSVAERARSVRFWGFRGPLGAWICIWGSLAMIGSVPFDDWWHNAYGLDVKILSPPHTVLGAGMMAIQLGAMIMALGAQNRARVAHERDRSATPGSERRFAVLFLGAAGIFIAMAATIATQFVDRANLMHGATFYKATAFLFPLLLLAVARASGRRLPATTAAAIYMGILIGMIWILQLFPATPRLAPINNPVTRMVPVAFPLLLIVPALVLDLLVGRLRTRGDWTIAAIAGIAFVAVMVVVHWPWADFMLSPAARNFVFASDQWAYMNTPGPWRYQFWTVDVDAARRWAPMRFATGLLVAAVIGILSSRLGLAWGRAGSHPWRTARRVRDRARRD